ncbi:J-domain-containing protein [Actinomadura kijaniata]|uniref:DnaJ family domain-containing protein n=1 Tax=Actinomadura kijaniata TaxID=46161 RepID=UPI000835EEAF|nr:DUF1992 domain-containing protein [Actinomadura kijaniata]
MTERKPIGVSFETWIDRQIREATERGEFDDLPGAGKPIPGAGRPLEEMWWIKQKLRSENLTYVPPSLALRKEAEQAREEAARARSEDEVRAILDQVNKKIVEAIRTPPPGPPLAMVPFNVERAVEEWRRSRPEPSDRPEPRAEQAAPQPGGSRTWSLSSWWKRRTKGSA